MMLNNFERTLYLQQQYLQNCNEFDSIDYQREQFISNEKDFFKSRIEDLRLKVENTSLKIKKTRNLLYFFSSRDVIKCKKTNRIRSREEILRVCSKLELELKQLLKEKQQYEYSIRQNFRAIL